MQQKQCRRVCPTGFAVEDLEAIDIGRTVTVTVIGRSEVQVVLADIYGLQQAT